MRKRSASS
jgi:hypothetical protein